MNADLSFKKYPYFLSPQLEALENASDAEERRRLVRRVASLVGDEEALRRLLGVVPEEFADFYPDRRSPDLSTDDTISSFLEHFGGKAPVSPAGGLPTGNGAVPVTPAVNYADMLDRLEEEADAPMPGDSTSSAIDAFLQTVPPPAPKPKPANEAAPKTEAAPKPESAQKPAVAPKPSAAAPSVAPSEAVETMASVRDSVRKGNYNEALEMLTRIQLRNPEAVPYAGDQIRFLRKLIATSSRS